MLKGHQCPFKDYSPRSPHGATPRSKRGLGDLEEGSPLASSEGEPLRQRARAQSALSYDVVENNQRLAAMQLLRISKSASPTPPNSGDVLARFISSLAAQRGIEQGELNELFNRSLQAALDSPPEGKEFVSRYTLASVRNLMHLRGLSVRDDVGGGTAEVCALSCDERGLCLHIGGDKVRSEVPGASGSPETWVTARHGGGARPAPTTLATATPPGARRVALEPSRDEATAAAAMLFVSQGAAADGRARVRAPTADSTAGEDLAAAP
jgi:hypothetical protein